MLDTDENQDLTDDKLSPAHRNVQAGSNREEFDGIVGQIPREEAGDMERRAIDGAIDDMSTPQDKAEKDKIARQTSDGTDLFNPEVSKDKRQGRFRATLSSNRKKAVIGLSILILGGGGFGLFGFLQGTAQLLHLNSALGKSESAHSSTINRRIGRMLYRSMLRNSDDSLVLARSRLGFVQNRVFGGMLDRLESRHGITFTETAGRVTGASRATVVFDLPDDSPLKGRTGTLTRLNIAREFGIDPTKIINTEGVGNGRFKISQLDLNAGQLDGLKRGLARLTGGGNVTKLNSKFAVAINKRMFAKVLRLPSLFHPLARLSEAAGRRIDNLIDPGGQRRARKQADAESRRSPTVNERESGARSELRSKVSGNFVKTAGVAIALQGAMCMVRDIAGIVPRVYYATVVTPSMIRVIQTQGVASQLMSGEDFTGQQIGDALSDLKDANGRSVWGAKSLNALANGGGGSGTDIDRGTRSAFTTKGGSITGLMSALEVDSAGRTDFLDSVSGLACSGTARVIGLVAGVAITIGGIVGGVATGGTTTAGAIGRVAVQAALAGTVSYTVSKILSGYVEGEVGEKIMDSCGVEFDKGEGSKPEDIEVLNAEAAGNCMAFAARMSSNINAASMGGVPISSSDELALLNQADEREVAEFRQKGLFERLFSTRNERSLLMAALRPSVESGSTSGNLGSMVAGLFKMPTGIANSFLSVISPKAHAQTAAYDWGFPAVSMPASIAEDPQYDSVENVKWLTANRGVVDAERVKKCFGKMIVGEGEQLRAVLLDTEINPLSDEYNGASCGDLSDPNWIRTALFIMDDSIAGAMDCYDGGTVACTELGIGNSGDSVNTEPLITGDTSSTLCAAGVDWGVRDGYENGKLVKIKVCNFGGGLTVNSQISGNFNQLLKDATVDGIKLSGGGFRDMENQILVYRNWCEVGGITPSPGPYPLAIGETIRCPGGGAPGYSNHQMGLAIDFYCDGKLILGKNVCFDWLVANAGTYGLYEYGKGLNRDSPGYEAWHWSVDGN